LKKALCVILCISMLFLMAGCGDDKESDATKPNQTTGTGQSSGRETSGNNGDGTSTTTKGDSGTVTASGKPEDAFRLYLDYWVNNEFAKMYDMLADFPKSKITSENFIQKYTDIHERLDVSITVAEVVPPVVNDPVDKNRAVVPYKVTIQTIAGEISYESNAPMLKNSQGVWKVEWTTRMIFPDLAEGDTVAIRVLKGKRGEIMDRNGLPLAINGKLANVGLVPERLPEDATEIKKTVAQILETTVEDIDRKLNASYVRPYMFVPIKEIPSEETEKINMLNQIPGVMIQTSEVRAYPLKEMAAHLTGYVQVVNEEDVKKGYMKDEYVGRTGLELAYEEQLRPRHGCEIYIADSHGYSKKVLARKEAQNGEDVQLTIDTEVQAALYEQLKEDWGTGVAINPKTGEVLALVSTPAYDPNKFVTGFSGGEWNELSNNPGRPLFNRLQATFCPGSIFKPVTAAIALENGVITPETEKTIEGLRWQRHAGWGGYYVKRVSEYPNPSNLEKALVYSDNIFFAQLALEIGNEKMLEGVEKFGFGEQLPFDFTLNKSQFDGDGVVKSEIQLADSGYGQGEILVNPVHLAAILSSFVNEGNIPLPYIKNVEGYKGEIWKQNAFSKETADTILDCLKQVVLNPEGTGHEAYIEGLSLAAKTGTGELKGGGSVGGDELGWFAAVNTDEPELLVLAMVEKVQGRGGSHYVVPMVRNVFEQVFKK
jgi:cell division protein FtsI/penicillin-binding protein 2